MRKLFVVALAGSLAALIVAAPASAAPKEQCGGQGVLTPAPGSPEDENSDGFVCMRPNGRSKDNNERATEPLPSGSQCPAGSFAYPGNSESSFDANNNGQVCVNPVTGAIQDDNAGGTPTPPPVTPGFENCPPGFEPTGAFLTQGPEADINENGVVCREPNSETLSDDF